MGSAFQQRSRLGKINENNEKVNELRNRIILAGGISINNIDEIMTKIKPAAIDVSSSLEKEPGKKDPELLREFIRIAKEGKGQNAKAGSVRS